MFRQRKEEQNVQKRYTIADHITSMANYTGVGGGDSMDSIAVVRVALHIAIVSAFIGLLSLHSQKLRHCLCEPQHREIGVLQNCAPVGRLGYTPPTQATSGYGSKLSIELERREFTFGQLFAALVNWKGRLSTYDGRVCQITDLLSHCNRPLGASAFEEFDKFCRVIDTTEGQSLVHRHQKFFKRKLERYTNPGSNWRILCGSRANIT
jgi:hypothetical protein